MIKMSIRPYVIPALMALSAIFYYFGELADWAAWESLRLNLFYSVHDMHRMLFLVPITLAGYTARIKGAIIVTLVSFIIFLPRAFFISPYPDAFLRMFIFTVFAGSLGVLTGVIHNQIDRLNRMDTIITRERDKLLKILDNIADGMVITGPDYKIRYMNSVMVSEFGDGVGKTCYEHLYQADAPCKECRIESVINSEHFHKWQCRFPGGRSCDVVTAHYTDIDGTVCQIATFRNIAPRETD